MIKKKEKVILLSVFLLAGMIALFFFLLSGGKGEIVRIMTDGKEYGSYSLSEDQIIEVKTAAGCNRIVIKNHSVFMEYADCPDQYCVKHKPVSNANETIVCLPHKLVVEVHSEKDEVMIDGISR